MAVYELVTRNSDKGAITLPVMNDDRVIQVKRERFFDFSNIQEHVIASLFQLDPEEVEENTPEETIPKLTTWLEKNAQELSKLTCQFLEYNDALPLENRMSLEEIVKHIIDRLEEKPIIEYDSSSYDRAA